ncbi:hypothetical protein [Ornithinimicrobium kibberense]|uniref:hypothetical protein n=1 Tax=Ornithinimicrobium kibberense TaxID=282060 RepID=UPI003612C328
MPRCGTTDMPCTRRQSCPGCWTPWGTGGSRPGLRALLSVPYDVSGLTTRSSGNHEKSRSADQSVSTP